MELDPLIDAMAADFETRSGDLLGLDAALTKLAEKDARSAELVELHFFGGCTMDECARTLGVSERQAYRWWQAARAFLHREVKG